MERQAEASPHHSHADMLMEQLPAVIAKNDVLIFHVEFELAIKR
jgi:hypothetical protein